MKIGIVLYPTFGGSGVVATELGKELAKKGHEIHFITYSEPVRLGSFRENIFYHEVSVVDYPLFDYAPYELILASKLVNVVKYEKLDLLHVHYAIPHASAAYMAKQILAKEGIHIPYITTLHGTDITLLGRDASFEPVITFAINESDAVTSVSESLRKDTFTHFKISRKIEVIPNFLNVSSYLIPPQSGAKSRHAPNGEKIICHISNFRKVKRVEDVVEVFKKVREKIPTKLLFVGDGPERSNVERLCREYKVCGDIVFLGKLKSTKEILNLADLFVLPSETESFGVSALEAMASGVPVIATNTGGLPELVQDDVSGFLSPVGDTDKMATDALRLLENQLLLNKFKQAAIKRAADFDINKILPLYEELYNSVINAATE
ncbi:MAG: N-acetyl-alpha-D-glucosaminyl L-malate synthase BshA [Flavobacteriales bacterium]